MRSPDVRWSNRWASWEETNPSESSFGPAGLSDLRWLISALLILQCLSRWGVLWLKMWPICWCWVHKSNQVNSSADQNFYFMVKAVGCFRLLMINALWQSSRYKWQISVLSLFCNQFLLVPLEQVSIQGRRSLRWICTKLTFKRSFFRVTTDVSLKRWLRGTFFGTQGAQKWRPTPGVMNHFMDFQLCARPPPVITSLKTAFKWSLVLVYAYMLLQAGSRLGAVLTFIALVRSHVISSWPKRRQIIPLVLDHQNFLSIYAFQTYFTLRSS